MNIILAYIPSSEKNAPIIHIGLVYLAEFLENNGFQVNQIDLRFKKSEDLYNIIDNDSIIGFSLYDDNFNATKKLIQKIKKSFNNIKIIVGGPLPSAIPIELFKFIPELDVVITGKGELPLLEVIKKYKTANGSSLDFEKIPNILFKEGNIIKRGKNIKDLNKSIEFPKWFNYDLNKVIFTFKKKRAFTLFVGNDCSFNCKFCAIHTNKIKHTRNLINIKKELKYLHDNNLIIEHFSFIDSDSFADLKKTIEIAKFIGLFFPHATFNVSGSVTNVLKNRDSLKELKALGLTNIQLGIESFNDKVLRYYQKKHDFEDIRNTIKLLDTANINIEPSFIFFNKKTTVDDLKKELLGIKDFGFYGYNPCDFLFYGLALYTGTKFWLEETNKQGKHEILGNKEITNWIEDNKVRNIYKTLIKWRKFDNKRVDLLRNINQNKLMDKKEKVRLSVLPYLLFESLVEGFYDELSFQNAYKSIMNKETNN